MDDQKTEAIRNLLENEPDMQKRLSLLAFDMHMTYNPYKAVRAWGLSSDEAEKLANEPIVAAAHRLGISPEELVRRAERTTEEQETIRAVEKEAAEIHEKAFARSRYGRALAILDALTADALPNENADDYSQQAAAVLCFFAMHPNINPHDDAPLSPASAKKLISLHTSMCDYMSRYHQKHKSEPEWECIFSFLKAQGTPRKTTRMENVLLPLDKVNSVVWSFPGEPPKGIFPVKSEKAGSSKQVNILCGISFDGLKKSGNNSISKKLTAYDERVYIAIASLFDAGRDLITLDQIHKIMGNTTRATNKQRLRISEAIEKMCAVRISIDNQQEINANYQYPREQYNGQLLYAESIKTFGKDNVTLTEERIHILSEPRLLTFAKLRSQVQPVPLPAIAGTLSQTEQTLAVEHYVLKRISRYKSGHGNERILYDTIAREANIPAGSARKRLPEKVCTLLEHYKTVGFIGSYSSDKSGVTVSR